MKSGWIASGILFFLVAFTIFHFNSERVKALDTITRITGVTIPEESEFKIIVNSPKRLLIEIRFERIDQIPKLKDLKPFNLSNFLYFRNEDYEGSNFDFTNPNSDIKVFSETYSQGRWETAIDYEKRIQRISVRFDRY